MTSSRGNIRGLMVFGLLLMVGAVLLGLVGLASMGAAKTSTVAFVQAEKGWIEGQNSLIREDLVIQSHATKHGTQTWDIYRMLLEGRCAASMTYCGASDIEKLHICVDPVTGAIGAVLQFGDDITTGFYEGNVGYWKRRVRQEHWGVCR